ncbi:MAG: hypothetical protein EBU11_07755 [Gammaproteobacteria bacterium]|jgi:hypothetical protein|nr:hypothetical protein [Gammaproteobacteria bacterium]
MNGIGRIAAGANCLGGVRCHTVLRGSLQCAGNGLLRMNISRLAICSSDNNSLRNFHISI